MAQSLHQVATHVNTARSVLGATICRMEPLQKRQGNRLKEARIAAGFKKSRREAAIQCGWPYSTYAAHERGTRTIGRDDAERYTRKFRSLGSKITAEMVLFPDKKQPQDEAESDYQRGWRDAIEYLAAMSQDQPPRKRRP